VTVGLDGTVSAELNAGGGQQNLGRNSDRTLCQSKRINTHWYNLITASAAPSGQPQVLQPGVAGAGKINQGLIGEASNVNVVEEMVNMIETQRAV
jgi:flagellar basal-body rod protein FlgG